MASGSRAIVITVAVGHFVCLKCCDCCSPSSKISESGLAWSWSHAKRGCSARLILFHKAERGATQDCSSEAVDHSSTLTN
jgi:hypothetical protein